MLCGERIFLGASISFELSNYETQKHNIGDEKVIYLVYFYL